VGGWVKGHQKDLTVFIVVVVLWWEFRLVGGFGRGVKAEGFGEELSGRAVLWIRGGDVVVKSDHSRSGGLAGGGVMLLII
jgi:hypothetical protein